MEKAATFKRKCVFLKERIRSDPKTFPEFVDPSRHDPLISRITSAHNVHSQESNLQNIS
jgi:hypothetical protein